MRTFEVTYQNNDGSTTSIDDLNIKKSTSGFYGNQKFLIFGITENRNIMPHQFYELSKEYQAELLAFNQLEADTTTYLRQLAEKEAIQRNKALKKPKQPGIRRPKRRR